MSEPLLFRIQTSFPESDHAWVNVYGGGQSHEIPHVHRDHNLIPGHCMGEDILIRSASKTDMHGSLCWNSHVTGPTGETRAEVFVDQQPQGMGLQPRCRVRGWRGRPGGFGRRAWIWA